MELTASAHTRGSASIATQIVTFLCLTWLFSTPWWILLAKCKMTGHWFYILGLMCSPGTAGLVTALVLRVPLRTFGWRWPKWKWITASYFIPIGYSLLAYSFIWITGLGAPHFVYRAGPGQGAAWEHVLWIQILAEIPFGILALVLGLLGRGTLGALGEETGWHGFLMPALASRLSFVKTSLTMGVIWTVWHIPFLLFGGYQGDTPRWYSLLCFAGMMIPSGFLYTWIRLRSRSLWPCVILHEVHNMWIQGNLTPATADTGHTRWWVDEFGAALAITNILLGLYIWYRQRNTLGSPEACGTWAEKPAEVAPRPLSSAQTATAPRAAGLNLRKARFE